MPAGMPPLNPLHTFAVAARAGSFTAAAEVLGVSQAAVSRQISVLEHALGVTLFERRGRRVQLSHAGHGYLRDVGPAFDAIEQATRQLATGNDPRAVRVQVYPTFAARWLLARLPRFTAANPDCTVRLQTGVEPVDFSRKDLEVAVQVGDGRWRSLESALIFPDIIEPVASPRLIDRLGALNDAADLARAPILQTRYRRRDWTDWLKHMGWPKPTGDHDQIFESSLITYQAAIEGIGIAMGQEHLLDDTFRTGTLVRPFERPLARDLGYYAVWPSERRAGHGTRRFIEWLVAEGTAAARP